MLKTRNLMWIFVSILLCSCISFATNINETSPISINYLDESWQQVKHDSIQSEYFEIEETDLGNGKIKLCLIPKIPTTKLDAWYQDNSVLFKKDGILKGTVSPDDFEIELEQGTIVKSCFDIDYAIADYYKIGSNSTIYVYQNESVVDYSDDGFSLSVRLLKEGNVSMNDVFVFYNNSKAKFGAIDEYSESLNNYTYLVTSEYKPALQKNIVKYDIGRKNHVLDLSDICNDRNYSGQVYYPNCTFNVTDSYIDVGTYIDELSSVEYLIQTMEYVFAASFISDPFIDPSIEVEYDFESPLLTDKIRVEPNAVHLEINATSERHLVLDGDGDFIDVADDQSLDYTGKLTIVSWYKTSAVADYNWIFNKGDSYNRNVYGMRMQPGNVLNFRLFNDTANGGITLPVTSQTIDGTWHLFVATADVDGNATVYIDGTKEASTSIIDVGTFTTTNKLRFGRHPSSDGIQEWNGSIDEAMVFSRVLTQEEITNIYNLNRNDYNGSTDNLMAYWTFDDHPNNYYDSSENTNTGTPTNDTRTEVDYSTSENYLALDGAGDYVDVSSANIEIGTSDFTYSIWIKQKITSYYIEIMGKYLTGNPASSNGIWIWTGQTGDLLVRIGSNGEPMVLLSNSVQIDDDVWHHIAVTGNRTGNAVLYLDNVVLDTEDMSFLEGFDLAEIVALGDGSNSGYPGVNGSIDDVMVFNRSLTSTEITNIYNLNRATYNGSTTGLIGEWNFDKRFNDYTDSSGNGNTGIPAGDAEILVDSSYTDYKYSINEPYNHLVGYWSFDSDAGTGDPSSLSSDGVDDYIDTGISPGSNTRVKVSAKVNTIGTSDKIFGARDGGTNYYFLGVSGTSWYGIAYPNSTGLKTFHTIDTTSQHTYDFDVPNGKFYIDGIEDDIFNVAEFSTTNTLYFYDANGESNPLDVTIYYFKIWQDDILVRDFRPKSNGCFQDVVNDVEYCNDGTGDLVYDNNTYYPETSYDLTNLDNDGTYEGDAHISNADGIHDDALVLDGDGDYINIGDENAFDFISNKESFSISTWVYSAPLDTNYRRFVSKRDASISYINDGYLVAFSGIASPNRVAFSIRKDGIQYNVATIGNSDYISNWINVVVTWDNLANIPTIYINGEDKSSTGISYGMSSNDELRIGSSSTNYFNGSIDEVMIFDKALNQTEITDIYNNQSNKFKSLGNVTLPNQVLTVPSNKIKVSHDVEGYENLSVKLGYWNKELGYETDYGLVHHWTFDNTSFLDRLNESNVPTIAGTPQLRQGVFNNSIYFDNSGSFVDTNTYQDFMIQTGVFTLDFWLDRDNISNVQRGVWAYTLSGWRLQLEDDNFDFLLNNAGNLIYFDSIIPMTKGTSGLHHYIIQGDGINIMVYQDAVLQQTQAITVANLGGTQDYNLRLNNANPYSINGSFEDFKIYNRTLTFEEIKANYLKGLVNWSYTDYTDLDINGSATIHLTEDWDNKYTNIHEVIKFES